MREKVQGAADKTAREIRLYLNAGLAQALTLVRLTLLTVCVCCLGLDGPG